MESTDIQVVSENATAFDWVRASCVTYLVFFLIGVARFFGSIGNPDSRENMWFYFFFAAAWLLVTTLVSERSNSGARDFLALSCIVVNAFVVPFSYYAFGFSLGVAATGGVIYIGVIMALTPMYVALTAMAAGAGFAATMNAYYAQFKDVSSPKTIAMIAVAYGGALGVALLWRHVVKTMYGLLSQTATPSEAPVPMADDNSEALQQLRDENLELREQLVSHILELRELCSQEQASEIST